MSERWASGKLQKGNYLLFIIKKYLTGWMNAFRLRGMNVNETSPKAIAHLKWIQSVSDILKIVFLVVAVVYAFYALALIGGVATQKYYATPGLVISNSLDFACDIIRQLARVLLVGCCYKLCGLGSRGELFSAKIVRYIRWIGCAYLLIALTVFPQALRGMRDDTQMIVPRFISTLFVSFLFLFIGWILNVSLQVKTERESAV